MAQKSKPFNWKKAIRKVHLWLGLCTGLMVFLISITGALYAFRDEVYDWAHHDFIYNQNTELSPEVKLTDLWQVARNHMSDSIKVTHAITYKIPDRNWEFHADEVDETAISYFNWLKYDYIIYVNPVTQKVVGVIDHKWEFFHLVKMFHWSLWLRTEYGQPIVGWSVFIFAISLISGLILWWPKKRKDTFKSLKIKWDARWRRVNYDLHSTLGFYTIPFALVLVFTGLVWSFRWFMSLAYIAASMSITPPNRIEPESEKSDATFEFTTIDIVFEDSWKRNPEAHYIAFYEPENDSTATINNYVKNDEVVYYNGARQFFDQKSGEMLDGISFSELNNGEKLIYLNYDIHVGAIAGIWGKILAFIVSLLCASLPVSGFLIWWGRKNKK